MSNETTNTEPGVGAEAPVDDNQKPAGAAEQEIPMAEQVKQRILGAAADEITRLEKYASRARKLDSHREGAGAVPLCQALEAIASIKMRAEMSSIQVEMATKSAAMATSLSALLQARGMKVPTPEDGKGSEGPMKDLIDKLKRPGGGPPVPSSQED